MKILLIGGLSDNKFIAKTEPLLKSSLIKKIYLFRSNGNVYDKSQKVKTLPFLKNCPGNYNSIIRLVFDFYHVITFILLQPLLKIDLFIGIYLYPHGFYAGLLAKILRKPVILILPGSDLKMLIEKKKHLSLFLRANFLGVRGSDSQDKLVSLGFRSEKIFILHNVFDISDYKVGKKNDRKYDIVFTGFLRKGKRLDNLLKIVHQLKREMPNISCLICGRGAEKENLMKMVGELDLTENVNFLSYKEPIRDTLNLAKIFVLTSESEGLPMSMIEAMGCGLPVVVSDINDIPDVVKHGQNGFLVPPLEVDLFAEYCLRLLQNQNEWAAVSKCARNSIEDLYHTQFSFEAITEVWENKLKMAIKN